MNKKIFLLLLVVFSLVSISAISAADVNDDNQTLALDSSSDISTISVGDDNVLAMSNDDETLRMSYSDDLLGSKDATTIYMTNAPDLVEDTNLLFKFYIAGADRDVDIDIDEDDDIIYVVLDDEVVAHASLTEDEDEWSGQDIFKGSYESQRLSPGYHFLRLVFMGNDDCLPYDGIYINDYMPFKLKEGSKVKFTDFSQNPTGIIIEHDETMDLTFRAVSERTPWGLRNVRVQLQLDDNPSYTVTTGTDGELSFTFKNLNIGNHTFKISTGDPNFAFDDFVIPITVPRLPVDMYVDNDPLDLEVGDKDRISAVLDPLEAGSPTFTSSNISVVSVDSKGNYLAVGEGVANITVGYAGTDRYEPVNDVIVPVTVSKIETNIVADDDPLELDVDEGGRIDAMLDPLEAGSVIFTSSNMSVVTVDNKGNYKAIREGKANITISYAGDYKYAAADDVVVAVNVSKIETSIDVDEDSLELFVGDDGRIVAVLDPLEAGGVTFTSSNVSVVTVDDRGNFVAVGKGEANITITYAGDYKYEAADDVVVTVNVSKIDVDISVDKDSLDLDVDEEDRIIATLTPPDAGGVIFTSSNVSVVTVDGRGNFKAVGEGKANITVSFDGDYNKYAVTDVVVPVTVSKIETSINVDEDSLELFVGDSDIIVVEFEPLEAGSVTFISSNVSVVTVDSKGKVKAVGEGEANINVSFVGNYKYTSSEAMVAVKVSMIETSIDLNSEDSLELFVGDEDTIDAELNPAKAGRIIFTSSDESVVTVDGGGNLIAVGEGEANITLSFAGNYRYLASENVTVTVTVSKITTKIIVDDDPVELFVGDEDTIDAVLDPVEAGDITFTSSDESIVTVDNKGNLAAVGKGEANITVSFAGNNKYRSSDVTINVTVSKKNVRIELLSNDTLELHAGDEEKIIAYIILDDGSEMIPFDLFGSLEYKAYSDNDGDGDYDDDADDIIVVDEQGNVKAVGKGEAIIIISFGGNDKYEAADDVTVSVTVSMIETSINLYSNKSLELFVEDEDIIVAELNPEDAGDITFTSSNTDVVTVDAEGNLVAVGEGEAEITLSFDGDARYDAAEDVVVTITVSKIDTSINLNSNKSLELFVEDEDIIVAELNPVGAGNVTFVSSDESVVTVDAEGNLVAVGEGEAEITLSFDDDYKYNAASDVVVTVSVSKVDTSINVDEDYFDLFVGDDDSIVAELNPVGAGNVTFVSSDESVVTVDDEGNVVAVGEGEANITVSFAGDNKYAASEAIVTVSVSKVDTGISVDDDSLELFVEDEDIIVA